MSSEPPTSDTLPRIDRPDAGLAVVMQWSTRDAGQQRTVMEIAVAASERTAWADALLSLSWFTGTDGRQILAYAQWTTETDYSEFGQAHNAAFGREIDELPGVAGTGPVNYRLYRSGVRDTVTPGCIVAVTVEFDGPDHCRQKEWVDAVFDALASEAAPPSGGIGAHFHLSTDGTRVLNYALWTSEQAHRDAIERSGQGAVGLSPAWRRVQAFPGMKSGGAVRYRLQRSLSRPAAPSTAAAKGGLR